MKMSKQVANVKFGEISGKWIKGKSREEKEKREKLERLGWSSAKDSLSTKQNEKAIKSVNSPGPCSWRHLPSFFALPFTPGTDCRD